MCFKNFPLSFLCKHYLTGIYRKLSPLFLLQITPKLCVSKNFLLSFMCKHYLTGIYRKLSLFIANNTKTVRFKNILPSLNRNKYITAVFQKLSLFLHLLRKSYRLLEVFGHSKPNCQNKKRELLNSRLNTNTSW